MTVGPVGGAGEPLAYHRLQRAGRWSWWRPLVGVLALVLAYVAVPVLVLQVFAVVLALGGEDLGAARARVMDLDPVTPLSLAFVNVAIASLIPVTWLLSRLLHGLRPGWLSSVRPRIRWGWLALCLGLAVLALVVRILVGLVVPAPAEVAGEQSVNDFTSTTRDFLLVIALLTPLQAAGEEYVFRGYLTQAFGGLVRSPWLAVLAPALLFALAHGAQDPPVFFERFAFGVLAGALVVLTGGLEAGIALHLLHNVLAYAVALTFGDMTESLNATGGSWWTIPMTVAETAAYLALTLAAARSLGLRTTREPAELVGPTLACSVLHRARPFRREGRTLVIQWDMV